MDESKVKLVSVCCDLYADVAPAWEHLFHKHWPNCPYSLEFVTNSKLLSVSAPVHYIQGQDIQYGRRMRTYISTFCHPSDILLLTMSDYLLKGIDITLVEKAVSLLRNKPGIWHVRLRPMPPPQRPYSKRFGEIDKRSPYSLSLQPGLWRASAIHNLLRDDEDPWDIEENGFRRAARLQAMFLSTKEPAMPHINYYRKRGVSAHTIAWTKGNVPQELWPDACRKEKGER